MKYFYAGIIFWLVILETVLVYKTLFGKEIKRLSNRQKVSLLLLWCVFLLLQNARGGVFGFLIFLEFYAGYLFINVKILENVKYWIINFLFLVVFEQFFLGMWGIFVKRMGDGYELQDILACSSVVVILILLDKILLLKRGRVFSVLPRKFWYFVPVIIGILLCLSYMLLLVEVQQEGKRKIVGFVLLFVATIGVWVAIAVTMYTYYQKEHYQKVLEAESSYNKQQREYFLNLLKKEEETRRFRHDITNHLLCIQDILEREAYQDAKVYLLDILSELHDIQQRQYDLGDEVVNVILNYYLLPVREGCDISVDGYMGKLDMISQMDICTIFSNLCKNAVESVEENGRIRIEAKRGKNFVKIEIGNSCVGRREVSLEVLPETTKTDKKNHGFGLENVRRAVEKNQGSFAYDMAEKWFQVEVILPIDDRSR